MNGKMIEIPTSASAAMGAYLALPESGSCAGLVLLQEIFGINQSLRETADRFAEGRSMGIFDRQIGVLDLGEERKWDEPVVEEKLGGDAPIGREHTAMCYDPEDSRLVVFGGWDGRQAFNDLWVFDTGT